MSDWDDILDPGETILWQGRPTPVLRFERRMMAKTVFALIFTGFSVFWMAMAADNGGLFWMFGLIHFVAGISLMLQTWLGTPFRHRFTWYSLSTQRAFVATAFPWKSRTLASYHVSAKSLVEFIEGPLSSIRFAGQPTGDRRAHDKAVGFENLEDGAAVYRMIRDIQREGASA